MTGVQPYGRPSAIWFQAAYPVPSATIPHNSPMQRNTSLPRNPSTRSNFPAIGLPPHPSLARAIDMTEQIAADTPRPAWRTTPLPPIAFIMGGDPAGFGGDASWMNLERRRS